MRARTGIALGLVVVFGFACGDGEDKPDGASWLTMLEDSDEDDDDLNFAFLSVWGSAIDDLYFAGGTLVPVEPPRSAALHFDGQRWELLPIEIPQSFWWTTKTSDDTVWFAGEEGMIVRWEGGVATEFPTGVNGTLFGIWGSSDDDVWSVGGHNAEGDKDVIVHFDGDAWTRVDPPEVRGVQYFKVWGTGPNDVFIVGGGGTILHYDGSEWSTMESGSMAAFFTVHGRAPDDVWVVGFDAGGGTIVHYDGTGWTEYQDPSGTELFANMIQGVYATPEGDVFCVGPGGVKMRIRPDGTHVEETLDGSFSDLHAVWATSDGRAFAAGGNFISPRPQRRDGTIIYRGFEGEIPTEGLPTYTPFVY